jgi:hypothetical protein
MEKKSDLAKAVEEVYGWIDAKNAKRGASCNACGQCCCFESYGHRLFVTGVELEHFAEVVGRENVKAMAAGMCPYKEGLKCMAHGHRFAGCRIFTCTGDADVEGRLSEEAIAKFKAIGEKFKVAYRYVELGAGLDSFDVADRA